MKKWGINDLRKHIHNSLNKDKAKELLAKLQSTEKETKEEKKD